MHRSFTTDTAESTAQISEDEALDMLEQRGIQTQVTEERLEALSVVTDKHASGGFVSEWVPVVCRRDWVLAFLG